MSNERAPTEGPASPVLTTEERQRQLVALKKREMDLIAQLEALKVEEEARATVCTDCCWKRTRSSAVV